jgi:nitroreductase
MLPLLTKRKSTVCFDERPVQLNILKDLFEAARWAPSSSNIQPWRYIVGIKGSKSCELIFESLAEGNQRWAIYAPVLLVSVAQTISAQNLELNRHAWHDMAMSYSNLVYQATSVDLYLHPMAGFSAKKIIESFGIPDGFEPVIVAALGYKSECTNLSEDLIKRENRERKRMEINEFVYTENWGLPFIF